VKRYSRLGIIIPGLIQRTANCFAPAPLPQAFLDDIFTVAICHLRAYYLSVIYVSLVTIDNPSLLSRIIVPRRNEVPLFRFPSDCSNIPRALDIFHSAISVKNVRSLDRIDDCVDRSKREMLVSEGSGNGDTLRNYQNPDFQKFGKEWFEGREKRSRRFPTIALCYYVRSQLRLLVFLHRARCKPA